MDTALPWLVFRVLGFCCSFCFALRRRAIVDHILAVATPDYWGCFLSCRVAYRASGHKRRKDIFILVCLLLVPLCLSVGQPIIRTGSLDNIGVICNLLLLSCHACTLSSGVWPVQ